MCYQKRKHHDCSFFIVFMWYVVTWKAGRRRVTLASKTFLSKIERCTGCGPRHWSWEQRSFKFLLRQFVSLNKTKIICSMTDRKLSLPVVSVVWRSHQWLVATQTFQTYFRCSRQYNHRCKYTWFKWKRLVKSSWLMAKNATYLVSISQLLCLAFLYGWRFLNKISLDWPLTLTTQHLLQNFLTTLFLLPVLL